MILRTPGGVSNSFQFNVQDTAPSVFPVEVKNLGSQPAVIRSNNEVVTPANPVHPEEWITIYATGLGLVSPDVKSGYPGPYRSAGAGASAAGGDARRRQHGRRICRARSRTGGRLPDQRARAGAGVRNKQPGVALKIQQGGYTATLNVRYVNP